MREWKVSQTRSDTLEDKLAELELGGWRPHTIMPNGAGGILVVASRRVRIVAPPAVVVDQDLGIVKIPDGFPIPDALKGMLPKPGSITSDDVDWDVLKKASEPSPAPPTVPPERPVMAPELAPARPKRSRK